MCLFSVNLTVNLHIKALYLVCLENRVQRLLVNDGCLKLQFKDIWLPQICLNLDSTELEAVL